MKTMKIRRLAFAMLAAVVPHRIKWNTAQKRLCLTPQMLSKIRKDITFGKD